MNFRCNRNFRSFFRHPQRQISSTRENLARHKSEVSIKQHLEKLDIQRSSSTPSLSDVKIAFLLKCRQLHPLCGGDPHHYHQLKQSYAITAAYVSNGNMCDFNPKETATDMYYNTREVQEIRSWWFGTLIALLCTWFIIMYGLWVYMNYYLQAQALGEHKYHIVADTMRPWWHDEVEYEKSAKRLFIQQWMTSRGDSQRHHLLHEGKVIASGEMEGASISMVEPSLEHVVELRKRVVGVKTL